MYIKYPDNSPFTLSAPVGKQSSNYRAEVQALFTATNHLIEQGERQRNIVFLTDSMSALQALSAGPSDTLTRQLLEHTDRLSEHNNVLLQWIPAHVGIAGNEVADKLAKEGSKKDQPQPPISYREVKTLLKTNFRLDWKNTNGGYQPNKDSLHELDRLGQTTISVYELDTVAYVNT